MGLYLEPQADKREWMNENAEKIRLAAFQDTPEDKVLVCMVDNGFFVALAVAFSDAELRAFTLPDDNRPKEWYFVDKEKAKMIAPAWNSYIKD